MDDTLYPHEIILKHKKLISLIIFNISIITLIIYMITIIIPSINGSINTSLMQPITQSPGCCFGYMSLSPLLAAILVVVFALYIVVVD